MSFLSVLKTIGEDIEKGLQVAAPVVTSFIPVVGPALTEIEQVINALENSGKTLTPAQISTIVQSLTTASVVKQAAAAAAPSS